jgi:hypothetical protein
MATKIVKMISPNGSEVTVSVEQADALASVGYSAVKTSKPAAKPAAKPKD